MYEELHDEGFEILYFPCNQFANQASGSDEEIASFCSRRFGITFPLFKKLEVKKYISRNKDEKDDRNLIIRLEPKGLELREKALTIPQEIARCENLEKEEAIQLYTLLHKILSE